MEATMQTTGPTVRPARAEDLDTIVEFNAALAWESEHLTLDQAILRAGVTAGLADTHKARYFVVESAGRIVGQLMLTLEWSDWRNGWLWWIQSVYVVPESRRQGIFRLLYEHVAETAARAGDVAGLRLYMERDNSRAEATYLAVGMERTPYVVLERVPLKR
jgi:GNAT superfamily N-acetyltransferase